MSEFKVGDRVRIIKEYPLVPALEVGDEGTVMALGVHDDPLVFMDDARGRRPLRRAGIAYHWTFGDWADALELVSRKDTPRKGDTVRVVLEGPASMVNEDEESFHIGWNVIHTDSNHVKSIEIITPDRPSAAYLPEGSVVLSGSDGKTPFGRPVAQSKYWYVPGHTDAYVAEDLDKWGWILLAPKESE